MKKVFTLLLLAGSWLCQAQNSFPANGITVLNSGGDQSFFIKDGRSGTNWNYFEWRFSNDTRDWILGRRVGTGYFTLYREGIGEVFTVDNSGKVGIGTISPGSNSKLNLVGGALEISALSHQADASLHISTSFGGFDRLTQIYPSVASKPALNLMGSTDASTNYYWWSWGAMANSGTWAIQPSSSFGGSTGFFINYSGYAGIGTSTPVSKLTINSAIERESFRIYKDGNTTKYLSLWQGTGGAAIDPIGTGLLYLGYDQTTDVIINGKVGIGTSSPNQKLTVNGTIYGKEVKVDLSVPGPDYIFEKSYLLPTLDQVKSYIDQNKHLPEVPPAAEMEKNGINLSEMNIILLKKVEELTLYMIEQETRIKALEEQLKK